LTSVNVASLRGVAAASTFASVLARGAARVKQRTANDPPREDFDRRTYLRQRRVAPSPILELLASLPRDDETLRYMGVAESCVQLGMELARDETSEAAMLRAFERAAGATRARDGVRTAERLAEVTRFAERAAGQLTEVTGLMQQLSEGLVGLPVERIASSVEGESLDSLLPDDVLARIYRAGVKIGELREARVRERSSDPSRLFALTLDEGVGALAAYSEALRQWSLERDLAEGEPQSGPSLTFEVVRYPDGRYGWRARSRDGEILATSEERYDSRSAAYAALARLRGEAAEAPVVDRPPEEPDTGAQ
jgi:uncharacterized protein YegP (UPF0339 family)